MSLLNCELKPNGFLKTALSGYYAEIQVYLSIKFSPMDSHKTRRTIK